MSNPEEPKLAPATIAEALDYAEKQLASSEAYYGHGTDNPWDEAVQLVLAAANKAADAGREVLPLPLSAPAWERLQTLLRRRIEQRTPLPYLTGIAWFAGLQFACDQRAIIPRSPLAELIINSFAPWYAGPPPHRLLDLCCGGGSIGLAAAHYHPGLSVDLVDLDAGALALARENSARLQLEASVALYQSDLFAALQGRTYDLILSNPPYVNAADLASMPEEYNHEPSLALASGNDGLDLTRRILAEAHRYLEPAGLLVVEVGNSWPALEEAYPTLPFTWLEFDNGGHGVFALTATELQDYHARQAR